jgi:hypothetical protein
MNFAHEAADRTQVIYGFCKRPINMARPERFELPTLWFEASETGNLNASRGVA